MLEPLTVGTRKCFHCLVTKDLTCFSFEKKRGYHPWCKECKYTYDSKRILAHRLKVIELYGGKCECCGETRYQFLCIDHQDGSTQFTRRAVSGGHLYAELAKDTERRKGIVLSCHNCNMARAFYGICPHDFERQNGQS